VRDLDLGRPVRDVDLVIEGDGIVFARELSVRLEAAVREHGRFGTATLTLGNGEKMDVASTRRETYAHPGALPAVTVGASIAEDLARRDFTINAMALGLWPRRRRIDPFGGREDLSRGVVRALHDRSFVDDPTRGFRAVRYANRLGFRIHPATSREIAAVPALRALGRVSGDRLRREIRLLFEEPRRGRATAQLDALGLARAVDAALATGRPAAARVARAEALAPAIAGETTWLCYLLAWMWRSDEIEAGRVTDRLALVGAEGRILRRWPETARRLSGGDVAGSITADEITAAAAALPPARRRALVERAADRAMRLGIRGADLLAAGVPAGPAVGAALARTLAARREGRIAQKDELAFALSAAKESR
jgi:tRNA nucleotidyltransferase (CCA-adding enzyme)